MEGDIDGESEGLLLEDGLKDAEGLSDGELEDEGLIEADGLRWTI